MTTAAVSGAWLDGGSIIESGARFITNAVTGGGGDDDEHRRVPAWAWMVTWLATNAGAFLVVYAIAMALL